MSAMWFAMFSRWWLAFREDEECAACGGKGHSAPNCPWRRDRRVTP